MKIAPREIIWKDFRKLQRNEELLTEPVVEDLLFMQTIEGHAHNGDGEFKGRKFVDTTINDIIDALGRDIFIVRSERQMLIDEIYEFVDRALYNDAPSHLVNKKGEPLMRCPLFLDWVVDPYDVLRGLYLGGLMDDFETRKKVNEMFGTNLGGGKPYLIDLTIMEKMGLDGEILSHGDHEAHLEKYRDSGLILDTKDVDFLKHSYVRFQYIRHKRGPGISDDSAVLFAGLLYNSSTALGVYLADAIDTLDKFSLKFVEQDGELTGIIKRGMKGLNIEDEDVYKFIYLATIPEEMESEIPDSSQRYFLKIESEGMTTLESHYRFLNGLPYPEFKIGYERVSNKRFYDYISKRFKDVIR